MSCLLSFTLVSCAGKKPRDPDKNYVDAVKYTEKKGVHFLGLFLTRPAINYHVDKSTDPPAVFVSFEDADVSEASLPRRFDKKIISDIEIKTETIEDKTLAQVWFHLNADVDYTTKPTEYGVRVDLIPTGKPLEGPAVAAQQETPPGKPQEELAAAEDIKELEESSTAPPEIKDETEALREAEPPPSEPEIPTKAVLSAIQRQTFAQKERIILQSSEAIDFNKTLLDRQIVIELKATQLGEDVQPMDVDEEGSFLQSVSAAYSGAPYPATTVTIALKDNAQTEISQNANEIYIDIVKRKQAHLLEEEQRALDFGNYLSSPAELPGREISLHARETSLEDILRMLAEASDYNMILGSQITGTVNLRLVRVPWDKAFVSILESHQLGFVKNENIIRISTLSQLKSEKVKAAQALAAKQKLDPIKVLFIPLQFRKASDIKQHLYPFLSKRGSLSVDHSSNSLIIRDISDVLERTKAVVASLDTAR